MKNELTVLKSIRHCKAIAKKLDEECKALALSSFCALNFPNDTLGQMREIAQLVCKRDETENYFRTVVGALGDLPRGYRALLLAVYDKNVCKAELCAKYGVSVATLYRKLACARKLFAENLQKVGADEPWFENVFDALDTFCQTLKNHDFDDAFDAYCRSAQCG